MSNPFAEDGAQGALDPSANPFKPGIGRVPPEFGGREAPLRLAKTVVDQLRGLTDPRFLLWRGVRGVGKTSLMAYVRRQAEAAGVLTAHLEADKDDVDLDSTTQRLLTQTRPLHARLARGLLDRLTGLRLAGQEVRLAEGRPPALRLEHLVADLGVLAAERARPLLLTVDEVHEAEATILAPLLRGAHQAAQDQRPFGLILSGLPGVGETLIEAGQTYTERLDVYELGMLDDEGLSEALSEPFRLFAGAELEGGVVDAVMEATAGYPYFVQLWGASLWDTAAAPDHVGADDVHRARPMVDAATDRFHEARLRRVPGGYAQTLVTALARLNGEAAINEVLREAELTHSQAGSARAQLIARGLVWSPERGALAFTVPTFARWLVSR